MNLLDVLDGEGWSIQQAIQTTFPFDPQFYSSYVRPSLQSRNCDLPLVLVDGGRYEREISSSDWQEAPIGTDYLLEPVNSRGVFHPKINLFASERSVFYSVTSANLTLEEYCKAAQIGYADGFQKSRLDDDGHELRESQLLARDIRDFYTELADVEGLITGQDATTYITETAETLSWLDEGASKTTTDRQTRFIANLSDSILAQVLDHDDIGSIARARLYAPYFGTPNVIRQLAEQIDPDRLELIVEPESTALEVAELPEMLAEIPHSIRRMEPIRSTRWVHAKFMVLDGPWGQACLYGSPNMTSSALLETAAGGNIEAGLLTVLPEGSTPTLAETVFAGDAFQFELSDPIADPTTLELRSTSYEGWESISHRDRSDVVLTDARLTQPDAEETSELILTIRGIDGEHTFTVQTEVGHAKTVTACVEDDDDERELSLEILESEREKWAGAVLTVSVDDESSNPRRVVEEMRAYYREFREMARSEGTQSSNTLLREILTNPDTKAIQVFDVALSELRKRTRQSESSDPGRSDDETREEYGERSPPDLTRGGGSLPSLHTLVKQHLTYHREQAAVALDFDDYPRPEDLHRFIEHCQTFWETIELCYVLSQLDQLESDRIDTGRLFGHCTDQLEEWFSQMSLMIQRINGVIDQIENNPTVREGFLGDGTTEVSELSIWESVFSVLFLHPGLVLDLDEQIRRSVIRSRNALANHLKNAFDTVHPHVAQHLLRGQALVERTDTLLNNFSVEFDVESQAITISDRGIRVLVLYTLIQNISSSDTFIKGLKDHPEFSEEDVTTLAEFALQASDNIVEYGLVNELGWSIVLSGPREQLVSLRGGPQ